MVSAPFSAEIANTRLDVRTTHEKSPPLVSAQRVATNPGWKLLAVTPVPAERRASSRV